MTILLISTVRRRTPPTEPSGYLYAIDLESEEILRKCNIVEPAYRGLDTNPRGGMRGSKGICVRQNQIAIANSMIVFLYDPQWTLLGTITHPSCAGIHDILFHDDFIWVASARTDLLLQFDLTGNLLRHYYMRKPSPALKSLGWFPPLILSDRQIEKGSIDYRDPRTHKEEETDKAHVNSLAFLSDGSLLVSLGFVIGENYAKMVGVKKILIRLGLWPALLKVNRLLRNWFGLQSKRLDEAIIIRPAKAQSAIVRIYSNGDQSLCLALPDMTAPSHSLLLLSDETAIYLNTTGGAVVHFDPTNGNILSNTKITNGFLRGASMLPKQSLILGSDNDLITFDLTTRSVTRQFQITQDPKESVYDIKILPSHFALPPISLADHFSDTTGFQNAEAMIESHKVT